MAAQTIAFRVKVLVLSGILAISLAGTAGCDPSACGFKRCGEEKPTGFAQCSDTVCTIGQ